MGKNRRHPVQDGDGKRSLVCVWRSRKYSRPVVPINDAAAWGTLTAQLEMARAKVGNLNPEIVVALLLGIGLPQ